MAADPTSRSTYDILVLGAGAAGLLAARILAQQGARVALVEARDRVGGRILTRHVPLVQGTATQPIELGAEFIHGLPAQTWELVREAQLPTYELDGQDAYFADDELSVQPQSLGGWRVLEQMQQWLALQPAGFDTSFAQFLRLAQISPSLWPGALSYVEGFNAADAERISVVSLSQQQQAEQALQAGRLFHLQRGYAGLMEFLLGEFQRTGGTLLSGRVVRLIQWRPGSVTMRGIMGADDRPWQLAATRAVITLPLGVLQAGEVQFDPPPADRQVLAHALMMGPVVRVTLVFRIAFWRDLSASQASSDARAALQRLGFLFSPAQIPATWWTPMPNDAPVITAWVGGPKALLPQQSWLAQCLKTLALIMHLPVSQLEQLLISSHYHDWQADPFARGAYSYVPAGGADLSRRMSEPVDDTLFFAGEHTDLSFNWGTVHGALGSGARAAGQLLKAE